MIMGNVLDSSSGTGRGICHESSICILFVSWGMMCVFLGLNGLYVLCCKRRRSITNFLAPLAILIVYLLVAYAYMAIRNQIKYGGHGDEDDDDGVFESSLSFWFYREFTDSMWIRSFQQMIPLCYEQIPAKFTYCVISSLPIRTLQYPGVSAFKLKGACYFKIENLLDFRL